MSTSPLAIITGSSSGIGLELAKLAARDGYSFTLAADTPFDHALTQVTSNDVQTLIADLSTSDGIAELVKLVGNRQVDVLCTNEKAALKVMPAEVVAEMNAKNLRPRSEE